jgi:hypothetical protein
MKASTMTKSCQATLIVLLLLALFAACLARYVHNPKSAIQSTAADVVGTTFAGNSAARLPSGNQDLARELFIVRASASHAAINADEHGMSQTPASSVNGLSALSCIGLGMAIGGIASVRFARREHS